MKFKSLTIALALVMITCNVFSQSAKLIVFRPASAYGSLAKYKVMVDGKEVTKLSTNSMYQMDITSGSHTVSSKQMNRAINIDAKAGETYVVSYKTPLHILGAKAKLKSYTLAEAQADKRFQKVMNKEKSSM